MKRFHHLWPHIRSLKNRLRPQCSHQSRVPPRDWLWALSLAGCSSWNCEHIQLCFPPGGPSTDKKHNNNDYPVIVSIMPNTVNLQGILWKCLAVVCECKFKSMPRLVCLKTHLCVSEGMALAWISETRVRANAGVWLPGGPCARTPGHCPGRRVIGGPARLPRQGPAGRRGRGGRPPPGETCASPSWTSPAKETSVSTARL